jgi:hypothetical protein
VAVKAAHFARPPGLGLDGREHGDNITVRRGSEYSIRTLQNADGKHGASDFFNRCTWYLIPSLDTGDWSVLLGGFALAALVLFLN